MIDFKKFKTDDGILVVRVAGELTGEANQYFFECIQDEIDTGQKYVVVNFADVGYINSAGLGMLVRARSRVKQSEGQIYLARIENKLLDIFSLLNFENIFRIFATEEEAIRAVRQDIPN